MIHGVTKNADLDPALLQRDIRPLRYKINENLELYGGFFTAALAVMTIISSFVGYGEFSWVLLIISFVSLRISRKRVKKYPLRRPMDPTDPDPDPKLNLSNPKDRQKANGDGIFIIGYDVETGEAVWINNDDSRTHMLVFGSTGSGKTRFLLSLFYQALLIGSGVMYVDGKGDTTVFGLVFSIVRRLGREDDLLVMNYLTGSRSPHENKNSDRLSNTTNPFSFGPPAMLRSLLVSLMRDSGGDDMWKGRASALMAALLDTLCYLRDRGDINLDIGTIRDYMHIEAILELTERDDLPKFAIEQLNKYLLELPGFSREDALNGNLSSKCNEQHNYLTMQLTEVMMDLSSTYGHIFNAPLGEIDYKDLVYNRRILFVMLPALEKDPDALAGLGKMVVAGVRSALAPALGEKIQGSHEEIMEAKPTHSNVPFLLILDEYGYYSVKGFSVVAAQARSLGVATIFAGQDLPSFKKGGEDEAKSVVANTNVKIFMKLEDSQDTLQLAEARAGQSDVVMASGHEVRGEMSMYQDTLQTRTERRNRLNVRDLVSQRAGQGHVFFGDLMVRCNMFFADPKNSPEYRINQMLMVNSPSSDTVAKLKKTQENFEQIFKGEGKNREALGPLELDAGLRALFNGYSLSRSRDQDLAMSAKIAFGLMEYREQLEDENFVQSIKGTANQTPSAQSTQSTPISLVKKNEGGASQASGAVTKQPQAPQGQPPKQPVTANEPSTPATGALKEEISSGLPFMSEAFEADTSIKEEAETIFGSLTDIINANIRDQIDSSTEALSPKAVQRAMPVEQLYEAELANGRAPDEAREEAERGMKMLDEKLTYPMEPQPEKMDKSAINQTLEALIQSIKQKQE